ncbi:MAG: hypothetical protein ABH803_00895 [Candidatus Micrarchaeota archaeon]
MKWERPGWFAKKESVLGCKEVKTWVKGDKVFFLVNNSVFHPDLALARSNHFVTTIAYSNLISSVASTKRFELQRKELRKLIAEHEETALSLVRKGLVFNKKFNVGSKILGLFEKAGGLTNAQIEFSVPLNHLILSFPNER